LSSQQEVVVRWKKVSGSPRPLLWAREDDIRKHPPPRLCEELCSEDPELEYTSFYISYFLRTPVRFRGNDEPGRCGVML